MNDIADKIMDMLDKWEWMTASIARYIIQNGIDPLTVPELN